MAGEIQNWFAQGGDSYARYRPDYPDALAQFLADVAPDTRLALDVGCGNGQFTRQLGEHFESVVGFDPSADQIANAVAHPNVRYEIGPAERLGVKGRSASLIAAAQAAHWFDLPLFYAEVRRAAVSGALIALVSYGVVQLEPKFRARFRAFYAHEIGRYWPAERKLVDSGYAGIDFPFRELQAPELYIVRTWTAADFLGYVSTWSAVRHATLDGQDRIVEDFSVDLLKLWDDPEATREFVWPINMRLGVVE